ncbi:MAG: ATP-grasp ribosomal peptide maturase [Pseudonocardia sp.]
MSAARPVLILTHRFDPTADKVVEELNNRGVPVFRLDTSEFPERLSVGAELANDHWSGQLRTTQRCLDLSAVSGIYYRRPANFAFHPDLSENERRWSAGEARLGFGGLLAALEPWLNHPHRIGYAEYKPAQLSAAVASGLLVPRTLVTNDPDRARAFVADVGLAVCKAFSGSGVYYDEGFRQVFCSLVGPEQCDDPRISRTMHLFQAWVPKDYDVRLTVVDGQFFAARIDGTSEAAHRDWRSDYSALSYQAVPTPTFVRSRVTALLDRLGLRFGALDFVVAPDGEWWFLECNPNGQWAWIEDETGMPIASAIADALEGGSKRG